MPCLTVIAGPNGSGKSTLIARLLGAGYELGEYLNADDIARTLEGSAKLVAEEAQQIVRGRREAALQARNDHSFETVMSHGSHIDYMERAAKQGFTVRLFFVATIDPAINLDRVDNRVAHGGHAVPADRIVARYHRCLANLPAAVRTADESHIFDNTSQTQPLRRLARTNLVHGRRWLSHDPRMRRVADMVDPYDLPTWWLAALMDLRSYDAFVDGLIA